LRNIRTETVGCLTGLRREGGVLTANFLFPETFIGFRGHFPGKPVLPGVCQIHCVLAAIEQGEGVTVALREVVLAKYAAPVFPGEELVCTVELTAGPDGERLLKARLTVNGRKVTEMKLRVAFGAGPG
jgi:3-hydroxymyristoyl/3-hydroxydecanoyl-(acyl carrier protein) dehydratase